MNFTVKQIEKVIRSGETKILTEDAPKGTGKLALRVRKYSAEWLFQYYVNGKRKMMKVANAHGAGSLTLAAARAKADEFRTMLVDGLDPKAELQRQEAEAEKERRELESQGTVEQLFQNYIEDLKHRGKTTWAQVERSLLTGKYNAAKALGRKVKANQVTTADIKKYLGSIHRRGSASSADHTRSYLHSAYQYGMVIENDYVQASEVNFSIEFNPVAAIRVDKQAKKVGNRVLSEDEIRSIFNEMTIPGNHVSLPVARVLQLMVSVGGARVKECVEARKDEFDLEQKRWNLTPDRTKNDKFHALPLSDRATRIIESQLENNDSEFLFPGTDPSKPIMYTSLRQAITRFHKKHDREHWSPRDIRRTIRTKLADAGEPDHRLDIFLNHGRSGVGQKHYDRSLHLKSKTKTMLVLDKVLSRILGDGETKVIPLHRDGTGE